MAKHVFNSTLWGGSGDAVDCGIVDGVQTYKYLTIDQAIAACQDGDSVTEDATSAAFLDAAGFPLQTITIPMGGNLTIRKSITLYGTRSRIRLDGGGTSQITFKATAEQTTVTDVDFVRLTGVEFSRYASTSIPTYYVMRCVFAGNIGTPFRFGSYLRLYDCAIYSNKGVRWPFDPGGNYYTRTTGLTYDYGNLSNCINLNNLTQAQVDAIGFVKPPKVYDPSNPGYYTDGTAWTMNDWQNVDLRLLSTSPYATGGTSVTSAETVYDLAGNKRKVGGALGAYECLSDVAYYAQKYAPGVKYTVEYDGDSAPRVLGCCRYDASQTVITFDDATSAQRYRDDTEWVNFPVYNNGLRYNGLTARWKATNSSGEYTHITIYKPTDDAPQNALIGSFAITSARSYKTIDGAVAGEGWLTNPTTYVGHNTTYASTASTVSKIYVAGWTTADLGDATAEVELGKGATVKTCGKITITGETDTSANLLNRVQLRDSAELTLDACNVTD